MAGSRLTRTLGGGIAVLAAVSLATLGALWALDRSRPRETPSWSDDAFVELRQTPGAPEAWAERWVVAFHPGCPHCRASLASLAAARDRTGARVRIAALIVDAPRPPADSVTMKAARRTSSGASAGAAERPTSASTGRSLTSSPM